MDRKADIPAPERGPPHPWLVSTTAWFEEITSELIVFPLSCPAASVFPRRRHPISNPDQGADNVEGLFPYNTSGEHS